MATNDNRPCVVGIGEALMDCFNDGTRNLGGAPLIFAYHAFQSHCNGIIVSAIGVNEANKIDKDGEDIKQGIEKLGMSTEYLMEVMKPSGTVEVDNRDKNDPKYIIKTNSAWSAIPYEDKLDELAKKTEAVYYGPLASYCGAISKQTIDRFLDAVPENCWKIFDVNLRQNLFDESLIKEYVLKCNLLKVNNVELEYLCGIYGISGEDYTVKSKKLLEILTNVRILLVTRGEWGSTVFWRNKEKEEQIDYQSYSKSVELKNTVGAGDAMAGAFIGGLLKGKSEGDAHYLAAQHSAHVCKSGESMPPITKSDIFVSYSREDEKIVVYFCEKLKDNNWTVWRDKENILHSQNFKDIIREAISNCTIVYYFSSKDANNSDYVTEEIKWAKEFHKDIIPIKLDATEYNKKVKSIIKKEIVHHDFDFTMSDLLKSTTELIKEKGTGICTSSTRYIIGIGELLWDRFPTYSRIGGAPVNFAYHASQFGWKTAVVSAIGKDPLGNALREELKSHNLFSYVEEVDLPTGIVEVDTSNANEPHYTIKTDVAWSAISYTENLDHIAKTCRAVCFGTLAQYSAQSRNTIRQLLNTVPKDCYIIYDVNLRKNGDEPLYTDETIVASIAKCNILKVNNSELQYLTKLLSLDLTGKEPVASRCKSLMAKYPKIKYLIVTMGTDGSWVFTKDDYSFLKTPKVDVIDVVGAGDSFTGAFIGSVLNGKTMKEAHQIAVNVSAYVCTQSSGTPLIPDEMKKRFK